MASFSTPDHSAQNPVTKGLYARWADLLIEKRDIRAIDMADEAIRLTTISAPGTEIHAAALIVRGIAFRILQGDIHRSQADYIEALGMLNPRKNRRVYCAAVHNLGCSIILGSTHLESAMGALKMAEAELRRLRVKRLSVPHAKIRWLRALVFQKYGSTQLAAELYEGSRTDLLKLGAFRDYLQVSLDLCRLLYIDGRLQRIRRIADELSTLPLSLELRAIVLVWQEKAPSSFDAETLTWLYSRIYGISFPGAAAREPSGL